MKIAKSPSGLKVNGRKFWKKVLSEYDLTDSHDLERLSMAAKCLDDLCEAEKRVKEDGMFTRNRYGSVVEHVGLKMIRDTRLLFLKTIRELSLDISTGPEARPPRQY